MTVVISKALRNEVLSSARRLLPSATCNLEQMYFAHAKSVLKRDLRDDEIDRIKRQVSKMLSI